MSTTASDFGVGGSIPGGDRQEVRVVTGQLGMLKQIFCGRTIVAVGPDPQKRRGMLIKFSDGSTVGIKSAPQGKAIELSTKGNDAEQPRRFIVQSG